MGTDWTGAGGTGADEARVEPEPAAPSSPAVGGTGADEARVEPEPAAPSSPAVEVRYNEDADQYELGMEVEGTWMVFTSVIGAMVESAQANTRENERTATAQRSTAGVR